MFEIYGKAIMMNGKGGAPRRKEVTGNNDRRGRGSLRTYEVVLRTAQSINEMHHGKLNEPEMEPCFISEL